MGKYSGITRETVESVRQKYPRLFSSSSSYSSEHEGGLGEKHFSGLKGEFIRDYEEAYWIPGRDQTKIIESYVRKLKARRYTTEEAENRISSWLLEVKV